MPNTLLFADLPDDVRYEIIDNLITSLNFTELAKLRLTSKQCKTLIETIPTARIQSLIKELITQHNFQKLHELLAVYSGWHQLVREPLTDLDTAITKFTSYEEQDDTEASSQQTLQTLFIDVVNIALTHTTSPVTLELFFTDAFFSKSKCLDFDNLCQETFFPHLVKLLRAEPQQKQAATLLIQILLAYLDFPDLLDNLISYSATDAPDMTAALLQLYHETLAFHAYQNLLIGLPHHIIYLFSKLQETLLLIGAEEERPFFKDTIENIFITAIASVYLSTPRADLTKLKTHISLDLSNNSDLQQRVIAVTNQLLSECRTNLTLDNIQDSDRAPLLLMFGEKIMQFYFATSNFNQINIDTNEMHELFKQTQITTTTLCYIASAEFYLGKLQVLLKNPALCAFYSDEQKSSMFAVVVAVIQWMLTNINTRPSHLELNIEFSTVAEAYLQSLEQLQRLLAPAETGLASSLQQQFADTQAVISQYHSATPDEAGPAQTEEENSPVPYFRY